MFHTYRFLVEEKPGETDADPALYRMMKPSRCDLTHEPLLLEAAKLSQGFQKPVLLIEVIGAYAPVHKVEIEKVDIKRFKG